MKKHYSEEYSVGTLIENYCTEEWKFIIKENEERITYPKGVTIFKEGDVAKRIKILEKGKAKVHSNIDDEKEQILRLASDKQVLGHRAFGGDFRYSVSATTLTECEVINIPLKLFLSVLKANNTFCYNFMMFFAEELKNTEQHIKLNGAKNLHQRVAAAILDNLSAFGYDPVDQQTLAFTLSRKDFASLSNTTYESVVRTLKSFSDMGILNIKSKKLEIIDEKKLIEISTLNY
jgi:CRP/FNR family transcriptional regulator